MNLPLTHTRPRSGARLMLLALTPSGFSGVACLVLAIFIIILHVVFVSLNVGTALPSLFDGQWAISYTNIVVQPLQKVFQNNLINQLLTIGMWSVVGLLVYEASEYFLRNYRGLREAKHDVQMVGENMVQRHPGLRAFMVRFVWRLVLGISFFLGLLALNPVFRYLFTSDYTLFDGKTPLTTAFRLLALNVLIWAAIIHAFVVFLRLYSMRPRFGRL